jgi:hypothetical protein
MKECTLNYNMEWASYGKPHNDIHDAELTNQLHTTTIILTLKGI